jgi:hypothetical protein
MSTPSEYADKAEVMLSIVGDPQTREEHFLAAQTLAIVGLVRLMSGEPLTASGYETCDYAMRIGHYQGDRTGFIEALSMWMPATPDGMTEPTLRRSRRSGRSERAQSLGSRRPRT